jgi:Bacteriophage baseplate protein W
VANPALGITLPLRLGQNGYFANTTDPMEQIRTNITNLLLTMKGERPMQPDFGSNLARILFEASSDDGKAQVEAAIQTAVKAWMPFLSIDAVDLIRDPNNEHTYTVNVHYTLLTTNITDSITLRF